MGCVDGVHLAFCRAESLGDELLPGADVEEDEEALACHDEQRLVLPLLIVHLQQELDAHYDPVLHLHRPEPLGQHRLVLVRGAPDLDGPVLAPRHRVHCHPVLVLVVHERHARRPAPCHSFVLVRPQALAGLDAH
eukprot:263977-Rhodomonas_salina.6